MSLLGRALPVLAVAAMAAGAAALPSNAPFISDEPRLIAEALRCNAEGRLAASGLGGSFHTPYGPLPTWFYQAVLMLTHDLPTIVAIRAALFVAVAGASLLWAASSLGLRAWTAPLALLSPWLYLYSRQLWDNTFNIPLGALTLAAYLHFARRGGAWGLVGAFAGSAAMLMVHFMALPLVAALGAHVVVRHRPNLREARGRLAGAAAVLLLVSWPYWLRVVQSPPRRAAGLPAESWAGWVGTLFSTSGLEYFFGENWWRMAGGAWAEVGRVAAFVGVAGHLLMALGLVVAARTAMRSGPHAAGKSAAASIALVAVGLQLALDVALGAARHPHYHNGVWAAAAIVLMLGVHQVAEGMRGRLFLGLHALAVLAATLAMSVGIHRSGGTRGIRYGPTLGQQARVVESMNRLHTDNLWIDGVANLERFPESLDVLKSLAPARRHPLGPRLRVGYAGADPRDARLTVEALSPEDRTR